MYRSMLNEFFGTFGRPDMSGQRGGETKFPPYERQSDFPYDGGIGYGRPPEELHRGITPKDTSHSAWDDLEEVLGAPILLSRGYQGSGPGSGTGVPGADGSWATGQGDWDGKEIDDDELERFGEALVDQSDDHAIVGDEFPSDILKVGTSEPFVQGLGRANRSVRANRGLLPKESAWDFLETFQMCHGFSGGASS